MNIIVEKSIGLTTSGKQFDINESLTDVNLFTHEAISVSYTHLRAHET